MSTTSLRTARSSVSRPSGRNAGLNSTGKTDQSIQVGQRVLEALDTPVSLATFLLVKYEEFDQLVSRRIDPLDYNDSLRFADDYQAVNLLRKASHLKTSFDRREVAKANFFAVEEKVGETNRRVIRARWFPNGDIKFADLISRVRTLCHRILGPAPSFDSLKAGFSFGPGASSSCRRENGHAYGKSQAKLEATPHLASVAHFIVNATHPWASAALNADAPCSVTSLAIHVVRGARIEFVPKDATTHRVIGVEPHVNIVFQKALDLSLRKKLKRFGIDLTDQSRNQYLARIGWAHGFSTIDLSNASDSAATELLREVLHPDWFALFDLCRSKEAMIDGEWYRLNKFSTAGCGFTFALETLLFFAIAKAASGRYPASVYGDDIIVRDQEFSDVVAGLRELGFEPNQRKSFSGDHPFRESCGEDFFRGYGCRPFHIDKPCKRLSDAMSLHNKILRYALRRGGVTGLDSRFSDILRDLRGSSRLLGPYALGDSVFASSFSDASARGAVTHLNQERHGWNQGYMVRGLLERPYRKRVRQYYAAIFYSCTVLASDSGVGTHGEYRTSSTKWAVVPIPVMGWYATDTFAIAEVPDLD